MLYRGRRSGVTRLKSHFFPTVNVAGYTTRLGFLSAQVALPSFGVFTAVYPFFFLLFFLLFGYLVSRFGLVFILFFEFDGF